MNNTEHGRVTFLDALHEMPALEVTTAWSTAEIYQQGAHVTRFQKQGEPPLLFLSQISRFEPGAPIRGGIPVIFPWFGARDGVAQHGFARNRHWEICEFATATDGTVSLRLRLPEYPEAASFPPFTAEYIVTVNAALRLQLVVTNRSPDREFLFENCLHTYFEVGDSAAVSITGLKGVSYLDKTAGFAQKTETADAISIASEVDRVYLDTTGPVEILDPRLHRKIRVEKEGSRSTVVWNPWIDKAQQMSDFGNEEYQQMVCVESGNVGANAVKLAPGATSTLTVKISSGKLP